MNSILLRTTIIVAFALLSCTNKNKVSPEVQKTDSNQEKTQNDMKSFVSLFEIPATDVSRAINFYQRILDINIQVMEMPGMEMGIFPYEEQLVTGIIIKGEGYKPSSDGVTIYLNGGDDLQIILDKIEKNGGNIMVPKTAHADESGFFALFLDTEGNKMGLNSPN